MKKRYFIELGDWFTCTSDGIKNEDGNYEFAWESDFQSGIIEYPNFEDVVEITEKEFLLLKQIIEDDELNDLQLCIKKELIKRKEITK